MRLASRLLWSVFVCGIVSSHAATDNDDEKALNSAQAASQITLTIEQWHAIGVEVAHPIPAKLPERIELPGVVLDSTGLVADAGEVMTAAASERAAHAEFARLTVLANEEAGVSGRMLEAATAEQAKNGALLRLANARFAQRWGPLMHVPEAERRALIGAVERDEQILVRADWPGRQSITTLPESAQVHVDGVTFKARVLGILNSESATMNAAILIVVPKPPPGVATGAHLAVSLGLAKHSGFLIPGGAVLYDEKGAYVFKQLAAKAAENLRYVRIDVKLLLPNGRRWLVSGDVDDDDDIVVAGVGALWSLESLHDRAASQDDDDD